MPTAYYLTMETERKEPTMDNDPTQVLRETVQRIVRDDPSAVVVEIPADPDAAMTRLGTEHGRAAGTWVLDGNSSTETARALLDGIRDGDPEVLDALPVARLGGEWADDPTPRDLFNEADVSCFDPERETDLLDAYSDAFNVAVQDQAEREARTFLGDMPGTCRACSRPCGSVSVPGNCCGGV